MQKYATEYRYGTQWNEDPKVLYKFMECKICGALGKCSENTTAITCYECVNEMCDPPEIKNKKNSGRPSGWHFMTKFIDKDGNVFYKGVEQLKLKGTLPPTEIIKKIKYTKKEKQKYTYEAAIEVAKLKKELKGLRWKKDKKVMIQKIKNYSKIMNGKFTEILIKKLFS